MAEMVGLIASVVAVGHGAISAVKCVNSVYRAQQDFETLQEQLQDFVTLVEEMQRQHASSASPALATGLSNAKRTIDQLDQLIQRKLLRHKDGTAQTRRRAWMRHKSKIRKFQLALREHVARLSAATSSTNLLVSALHKLKADMS